MTPEKSYSISITVERPDLSPFGVYFACATCHQMLCVMCELAADGTVSFQSAPPYFQANSLRSKLYLVRTSDGKVSILCGVCHSGITRIHVSRGTAGTSFSNANFDDKATERAAIAICARFAAMERAGKFPTFMPIEEMKQIIDAELTYTTRYLTHDEKRDTV